MAIKTIRQYGNKSNIIKELKNTLIGQTIDCKTKYPYLEGKDTTFNKIC